MSTTALGTRSLKLKIDGEEYTADVSKVTISSKKADSDFVSFADAANGGSREYSLNFTATQDPADPDSIWNIVWGSAGTDIEVDVLPYGGGAASASNPIFNGMVTVTEPEGDLLGGEADASTTARFTMELSWVYLAKPEKVVA